MLVRVVLPIPTISEANTSETPKAKRARRRGERETAALHLRALRFSGPALLADAPLRVVLTRLSPHPQLLDDDNLGGALKMVRDSTARWLGVDDGPREKRVTWRADQGPSRTGLYGVRLTIYGAPR